MSDPLVSVIIPCRLDEDLTEIFRWPDWAEMLFQFEDGIGTARNAGAELARAPILAFTDADIRFHGDLSNVPGIPEIDAAWTVEGYEYNGYDYWTKLGVLSLNILSEFSRNSDEPWPIRVDRMTQSALMVCYKRFFRPFTDEKLEDLVWGSKFPRVFPLPLRAELTRPWTNPVEWRRRRGQPV